MKNTFLVLCLGVVLVGCDAMKEVKIGPLSGSETKALSDYSNSIEGGLLAIDGEELFEAKNSKLSKAASDWLIDCTYTVKHDARGRNSGRTVNGRSCPIRADWEELIQGANSEAVTISYIRQNDAFADHIPVLRFGIKGSRDTEIEDGELLTTSTYRGTSVDQFGEESTFTAVRREFALTKGLAIKETVYTYDITVDINDTKFRGRINSSGIHFVDGAKITPEEFQTLFFVLK